MSDSRYAGSQAALAPDRRGALIERWLAGHAASRLRVPRPIDPRELRGVAESIVEALAAGLSDPACGAGSVALREAEKRLAFAGGTMGMTGATAFDVTAFVLSLRDALLAVAHDDAERIALRDLFDWGAALAVEGYATSREDALRLRHRDALERGTPVVMIAPELPVALLVGEPDHPVLESTFGRLLLSSVRVGAVAVVIDAGGLVKPRDPRVLESLGVFAAHRKIHGKVALEISGLAGDVETDWRGAFLEGARATFHERFEDAVKGALAHGGLEIARRRGT